MDRFQVGQTEQKQRAKFYRITAEGKKQLARDRSKWETMVAAIGNIMTPAPEG
jgi:PadR family transcriptional regulator, regulatory protein PadR